MAPDWATSSQHDDLLPQHKDLGFQRRARSEQINDNLKNYSAETQHPAEDHPILPSLANWMEFTTGTRQYSLPRAFFSAHQISLQSSLIEQMIHPIRCLSPTVLEFATRTPPAQLPLPLLSNVQRHTIF